MVVIAVPGLAYVQLQGISLSSHLTLSKHDTITKVNVLFVEAKVEHQEKLARKDKKSARAIRKQCNTCPMQ